MLFNLELFSRKPVGTWFGPNTVAQVLRKLCLYDPRYVAALKNVKNVSFCLQ